MVSMQAFNKIHWGLKLEADNEENPQVIRDNFNEVLEELMEEAEESNPNIFVAISGSLELRTKILALSDYLLKLKKGTGEMEKRL